MSDWPIFLMGLLVTAIVGFTVWNVAKTEGQIIESRAKKGESSGLVK